MRWDEEWDTETEESPFGTRERGGRLSVNFVRHGDQRKNIHISAQGAIPWGMSSMNRASIEIYEGIRQVALSHWSS